ncbi:MAG: hypothetical protein ACQETO_10490 [Pseudomonadota bacterium]
MTASQPFAACHIILDEQDVESFFHQQAQGAFSGRRLRVYLVSAGGEAASRERLMALAEQVSVHDSADEVDFAAAVGPVLYGGGIRPDLHRLKGRYMLVDCGALAELVRPGHCPVVARMGSHSDVVWWLYHSRFTTRRHIISHLGQLYELCGGIWAVSQCCAAEVRDRYPHAMLLVLPDGINEFSAARFLRGLKPKSVVVAHYSYHLLLLALTTFLQRLKLVVISHGRSGKAGKGMSGRRRHVPVLETPDRDGVVRYQSLWVSVRDYYRAPGYYLHLDSFVQEGGRFSNPVPSGRPRILLLPSWEDPETAGTLLSSRWHPALKELAQTSDLVVSPHPLTSQATLDQLLDNVHVEVVRARGHSFRLVPEFHAVLCDLSGVYWEALMFDTPVILALCSEQDRYSDLDNPPFRRIQTDALTGTPENIVPLVEEVAWYRLPEQCALSEIRLGKIDGTASLRLQREIRGNAETTENDGGVRR